MLVAPGELQSEPQQRTMHLPETPALPPLVLSRKKNKCTRSSLCGLLYMGARIAIILPRMCSEQSLTGQDEQTHGALEQQHWQNAFSASLRVPSCASAIILALSICCSQLPELPDEPQNAGLIHCECPAVTIANSTKTRDSDILTVGLASGSQTARVDCYNWRCSVWGELLQDSWLAPSESLGRVLYTHYITQTKTIVQRGSRH